MSRKAAPVVWLIWDAASDWVVRALLAERALPALERVANSGVRAAARPPSPNCQTPPSLATLFTGVWPWKHGVTGYSVPDSTPHLPVTARRSGFDPAILAAETIWHCAGRQGRRTVLVHTPWTISARDKRLPLGCVFAAEAYSRRLCRGGAIPVSELERGKNGRPGFQVGPFHLTVECAEEWIAVEHADTKSLVLLRSQETKRRTEHSLELAPGTGIVLQLGRRPGDGELLLLHSGVWQTCSAPVTEQRDFEIATGPFVGEGIGFIYRRGALGPRLVEGGRGEAERLLLRSIATAADYFERASLTAATYHHDADLYIFYQPCVDDVGHELIGWCDPRSKAYRPEIARQAWAAVRAVYQMADRHLASLLQHFGDACTLIVSSDHGMAGMTATVHVNEALSQARLLVFDAAGEIDLSGTQVLYHPANNGSLWLNVTRRAGGIVPPERQKDVLDAAIRTLRELRDAETNQPVIQDIYSPQDGARAGWNPTMSDLFAAAADGYQLSAEPSPNGQIVVPTPKSASHATYPDRPSLRGIFYARGPGIRRNSDLGEIDNRDLFPIVCHQLEIEPATGIEGRIPGGFLTRFNGLPRLGGAFQRSAGDG
jgi:predicted AlkP superfamily phosphohydrolase/phosphomutase